MTVVQACGPASVFQPGPGDLVPCRPGSVGLQAEARSVGLSRVCPGAGSEGGRTGADRGPGGGLVLMGRPCLGGGSGLG